MSLPGLIASQKCCSADVIDKIIHFLAKRWMLCRAQILIGMCSYEFHNHQNLSFESLGVTEEFCK